MNFVWAGLIFIAALFILEGMLFGFPWEDK